MNILSLGQEVDNIVLASIEKLRQSFRKFWELNLSFSIVQELLGCVCVCPGRSMVVYYKDMDVYVLSYQEHVDINF